MKVFIAVISLAVVALAEEQAQYANAQPSGDVYNEKTRFVVSPNFPYDYNGYPYNKAHAAVYQGIPAYSGYGQQQFYQPHPQAYQPQHGVYQPQPAAFQPQHSGYQPQGQISHNAYAKPVPRDPYDLKTNGMQYHGLYSDKCLADGLYYKDLNAFVICSNKNPSVQACAPGSRNPDQAIFKFGGIYNKSDFCSINLVDLGYAAGNGKGF